MSGFALKIIALLAMLIDHIGVYFETPILLRYIGRIAFPIFIFCAIWGYFYTKNRKKYLLRIYFMSILMSLINTAFLIFWPNGYYARHNIFLNFIFVMLGISIVENWKNHKKKSLSIIFIVLFLSIFHFKILHLFFDSNLIYGRIISGFIPSFLFLEYDFSWVIFGILLYFTKDRKLLFSLIFAFFSISQFYIFGDKIQWAMIFTLPIILLYNHKKGANSGWIFYAFYPLHILILYFLAKVL